MLVNELIVRAAPVRVVSIARQLHVDHGAGVARNPQLIRTSNTILDVVESTVGVEARECLLTLLDKALAVSGPPRLAVLVSEGELATGAQEALRVRTRHAHVGARQPQEELVVFATPAPISIGHAVDATINVTADDEHAADEFAVRVFGMQARRAHVVHARLVRIRVVELIVEWQQVHVVHGDVVALGVILLLLLGEEIADVDERGTIKAPLVHLVQNVDAKRYGLETEEARHVRHECGKLVETVAVRHHDGQSTRLLCDR